jgi:TPP-dependent indolepyruvate ferredoxin oxidoreductase alpha subunit
MKNPDRLLLSGNEAVGLNVAADPFFTAAYTGVSGALIVVSADDPGMASSQKEQDNRYYAIAAGVPMLEPSDSQEAYDYTLAAAGIVMGRNIWQSPRPDPRRRRA